MERFDRRYLLAWFGILGLVLLSLGTATYRLSGLPALGMHLGPNLQVRSAGPLHDPASETPAFKSGDFFVALEGSTLQTLRDLRVVLRSLPPEQKYRDAKEAGLRYQLLRREHRYTVSWQGNREDPTELPPGYNPETDVLVEIDGRQLPEAVGPEGVRSVIGHRSNVLLTFERRNAVFQGTVAFWRASWSWSVPLTFGLVGVLVLLLWRYRSRELTPIAPLAVAGESLSFGWILLLALAYQWLLADSWLASMTILGLVGARPLAIFARSQATRDEDDAVGWWALGLGVGYGLLVVALLQTGVLPDAETGLYAGASGAAFYLVYEVFAVAFDDAPHTTLQEGGGYLAGILVVGFAAAILIWQFEGDAFRFVHWRWFAIAFTALVGFGDLLFCLRGPSGVGAGELSTSEQRRERVRHYLESVADELPDATLRLVVRRDEVAATAELSSKDLEFGTADERVSDLVSILIREKSRIPLPESGERGNHPLSGIAQTMDIVLALRLRAPPGGMKLPETDIALIAMEGEEDTDLPSFASAETIDYAQTELAPSTWGAIFIEAMEHLPVDVETVGEADDAEESDEIGEANDSDEGREGDETGGADDRVRALELELQEAEERMEFLRDDRSNLASQLQMAERRLRDVAPPVEEYERLLEPELIETLEFLTESEAPIVIGGAYGTGKEFTARCAAEIEGQNPEAFVVYDAMGEDADSIQTDLFGDEERGERGYVETAVGASLLVRSAGHLSDTMLVGLCNSAVDEDIRLFLSFHEPDIESHSPLDEHPPRVVELLEHRELMIPSLRRRRSILPNILNYYLEYFSDVRSVSVDSFSEEALSALRAYDYPAEIREAKVLVDLAVVRSGGDRIEVEDLNTEVRATAGTESEAESPESKD